jgi:DNA-binding CsgD family transcriptional regulator
MTDGREEMDRLVLDIHAAPLDAERWPKVVDSVCRVTGAEQGVIFSVPRIRGATFWSISTGVSSEAKAQYSVEFALEDVWLLEVESRGATAPGTLFVGEELIDRRSYLRTRFFNEFLLRHDMDRIMNLALLPSMAATLSLYRGCGKEAFGTRERETLGRLTPHLILAVNTFWKARELSMHNAVLGQTLDAVTTPLFVVDRTGRLLYANMAAEAALRAGDCLRVIGGSLVPSPAVRERIACADALRGLLVGRAATVALTVGPTGRPVILSTAPISGSVDAFAQWGSAAGLLWLVPVPSTVSSVRRVAMLFALTAAEERLLARLADGSNLTHIAETLRISIHTARSQLKAIQRKTGWRTQGELVRMVHQLGAISPQSSAPP